MNEAMMAERAKLVAKVNECKTELAVAAAALMSYDITHFFDYDCCGDAEENNKETKCIDSQK